MEWKKLSQLVERKICYGIVQPGKGKNGNIPVIKVNNIISGLKSITELDTTTHEIASKFQRTQLFGGEIVVSVVGSVGNTAIVPSSFKGCNLVRATAMVDIKDKVLATYVMYYFKTHEAQKYIESRLNTTVQATLNIKDLEEMPIPILQSSIILRLVSILSALDSKIENNNRINANLESQAQALFKSWFVDFTPFKDQPFVDSELGPIPQGWKVGKLGDYCEVKSGYAFKTSWWTNKGYKIIKIKNISENGDINLNDCSCVLPENCDKAKNFIANTGDIVIAMTGATIGKFNIIPKIDEKYYINQRVGKFFLGEKPIEKVPYIYCFLKQENISTQIIQKGQGSAQPNISGADIESIPMLTPMSIILKYNKMCQPLFEKILSNRLESKKLSALRDTLLPKLMSGEIKL